MLAYCECFCSWRARNSCSLHPPAAPLWRRTAEQAGSTSSTKLQGNQAVRRRAQARNKFRAGAFRRRARACVVSVAGAAMVAAGCAELSCPHLLSGALAAQLLPQRANFSLLPACLPAHCCRCRRFLLDTFGREKLGEGAGMLGGWAGRRADAWAWAGCTPAEHLGFCVTPQDRGRPLTPKLRAQTACRCGGGQGRGGV